MIEKIMRAVKSNNKKRGRNITIGAVVGMLLSCTAIMGKDVIGLEIKDEGSGIIFSKNGSPFIPGADGDPYTENDWKNNTYTNNSGIFVDSKSGNAYGLKLSGNLGENFNLENNGSISGSSSYSYSSGSGIYLNGSTMGDITNGGSISGSSSYSYSSGSGIYLNGSTMGDITNGGSISGSSSSSSSGYASGVYLKNVLEIGNITNNGIISGYGSRDFLNSVTISGPISDHGVYLNNSAITGGITNNGIINGLNYISVSSSVSGSFAGNGVYLENDATIGNITNSGIISGYGSISYSGSGSFSGSISGYGVYLENDATDATIENITNTGVIYGTTNAINNGGTISKAHNYGLLVSSTGETVLNTTLTINKGLIFKADGGTYTATSDDFEKFGNNSSAEGYRIINAAAIEANKSNDIYTLNGTNSISSAGLSSKVSYILNGITNTVLAEGKNNEINNSVINAYKTAVVMEGDSNLTLENTIVNGGLDGEYDWDTKKYDNYSPAISVTGDNNFLIIKGDSIVNGDMKATGNMNTLNLYGKENKTRDDEDKSMNILHNIDGFGRIQIENEVTFFEDVKVTGVERLNINNGGTLSLRLKAGATSGDKATHALSAKNKGLIIAGKEEGGFETAGTLNFITNGMGTGTVIDMNGAELENVYLRTSSILYELEVIGKTRSFSGDVGDIKLGVKGTLEDIYNGGDITPDSYPKYKVIPNEVLYTSLNKIYQSSVKDDENVNAVTDMIDSTSGNEQWEKLLTFLGGVYTESPYSFSSELSRKSIGMFRDIITENEFRPNLNNWLIMGGFTHTDGGTKDTYYGKNYYKIDGGTSTTDADMKLTGAYMLAKYGYSENTSLGLTLGGNKSEAKMDIAKVKGNNGYLGAFVENYRGNLTLKAGAGVQYSEYDADRSTLGGHSYSDKYSDMTYDIYLNGRYSHQVGDNLFLEPYATLSYTYIDQDGANEGSKALAIETDSKSFDYTVGKVGVDLKKVIPYEKGKSTLSAGVSYTKILDGADEEHITGRFKRGSDFDILVAHKNEHSIGLNAKYALELENGVLFDVKGTYSIERDSHNQSGKNRTKGEWIMGAGMGYKF